MALFSNGLLSLVYGHSDDLQIGMTNQQSFRGFSHQPGSVAKHFVAVF